MTASGWSVSRRRRSRPRRSTGGPATPLTNFTDGSIKSYEWSPDGQRIVLTHYLQMKDVVVLNGGKR
jgi:hypothetical protein